MNEVIREQHHSVTVTNDTLQITVSESRVRHCREHYYSPRESGDSSAGVDPGLFVRVVRLFKKRGMGAVLEVIYVCILKTPFHEH